MTKSQARFFRNMIAREIYLYRKMKEAGFYTPAEYQRMRGDIARLWGIRCAMRELAKFDAEMAKR